MLAAAAAAGPAVVSAAAGPAVVLCAAAAGESAVEESAATAVGQLLTGLPLSLPAAVVLSELQGNSLYINTG